MKIGILTIHNSPNYGACLQCYALWKFLANNGFDVDIIDLHRPFANEDYIDSKRFKRFREPEFSFRTIAKSIIDIFKKNHSLYNPKAYKEFCDFNSQIKLSLPYKGIDELYNNPPKYDVYIAGSDQLWNPTQAYCLEPYFLTFVDGRKSKKISFSTSIGITELREDEKIKFKQWLEDFDAISVREKQAQALLSSFIKKDIYQVADPTFLIDIDEWNKFKTPIETTGYILLFTLAPKPELLQYSKLLCNESGKSLVVIGQKEKKSSDNSYLVVNDAGPQKWMSYIANADMVITDSFHCTVFSMLLGANNFYAYISPQNKRGSRIQDLLYTFNLQDHLISSDLNVSYKILDSRKIDKSAIEEIVNREKKRSRDFLLERLIK